MHRQTIIHAVIVFLLLGASVVLYVQNDPEPWRAAKVQTLGTLSWGYRVHKDDIAHLAVEPRELIIKMCFGPDGNTRPKRSGCYARAHVVCAAKETNCGYLRLLAAALGIAAVLVALAGAYLRRRRQSHARAFEL